MEEIVIVRSGGEIGIKSKPVRREYETILLKLIRGVLRDEAIEVRKIWRDAGRVFIITSEAEKSARLASMVFGVASTSPGFAVDASMDSILAAGTSLAESMKPGTFAVRCRRTGVHPYTSQEVAGRLGEAILGMGKPLKVNLKAPDQSVDIEIRNDLAILYSKRFIGPDGYPIGTQDPAVGVIDETSDSTIASWCVMKRGSPVTALVVEQAGRDMGATMKNLATLSMWLPSRGLNCLYARAPDVLSEREYRAFSFRVAHEAASIFKIGTTVSGMVPASLQDLGSLSKVAKTPVIFPLIAMDKTLFEKWGSIIGLNLDASNRYGTKLNDLQMNDELVRQCLEGLKRFTVSRGRVNLSP